MQDTLAGKIDGEIDMDMHGNITVRQSPVGSLQEELKKESGIQGSGTYVLRNGKLVPGKAEVRE